MRAAWLVVFAGGILSICLAAADAAFALDRDLALGKLIVGIDQDFPPFEYLEDGEPTGFNVELIRAVAAMVGYELEFQAAPWHEIRARLESGEIDLAPTMAWSLEREKVHDFSVPMVGATYTAFVLNESTVRIPKDLLGKRVLVQESGYVHDLLTTTPLDLSVETAESPRHALRRLAEGDAEAALLLDVQGLYLMRKHEIAGLHSFGLPLGAVYFRIAVADGRGELLAHLNDGLAEVRMEGMYDVLSDRWFGVLKPPSPPIRRLIQALSALGLLGLAGAGVAVAWSFTLRRRVEAARQQQGRLERRLHGAQKVEALGRLAGGVAHDFNNFLTVILGNVSLLRQPSTKDDQREVLLEEVNRAGEAAADLTEKLLSFARGQVPVPQTLNWEQVAREVEDVLRRLAPSEVQIDWLVTEGGWSFRMDPVQASQVLMNLVINAIDASEGGGVIEVRTGNEESDDRHWACLSIRDHGAGMDEATRERIFEPFFSTKGSKGTGLGLSTADGLVRQADGEIEVESAPGDGALFRVRLPRAEEAADASKAPDAPAGDPSRSLRILVVDDDPRVLETLGRVLESLGHHCDTEGEAEGALARLSGENEFDVLITDVSMPDLSGFELVARVRELAPAMPVIYTSGLVHDARELVDAEADPERFLSKPIDREALREMLQQIAGSTPAP